MSAAQTSPRQGKVANRVELRDQCRGRWPSIMSALGFTDRFVNGKHGPCPMCGEGTDRCRFTNYEDKGRVVCSQCAPSSVDGVEFVMRARGYDFASAAKEIREVLDDTVVAHTPAEDTTKRRADIARVWGECVPIRALDPVHRYLALNRGLRGTAFAALENVRYHPGLEHWHEGKRSCFPAMVMMVVTAEGKCATLHRTWITEQGDKADVRVCRKYMPTVACWKGGGVRLSTPAGATRVVVGEGAETCLALALRYPGSAILPALDAAHLAALEPPAGLHVVIAADNDASAVGQLAAWQLAHRLSLAGQSWEVQMPDQVGTDWADHIQRDLAGRVV